MPGGPPGRGAKVVAAAIEEGLDVLRSAGIRWEQTPDRAAHYAERAKTMRFDIPEGDSFVGGSTWQSLVKGAPTLETDFFHGEIVLLGRLHGVPTPTNEFLQHYAMRMLRGDFPPGSVTPDQLDAEWQAWSRRPMGDVAPDGSPSRCTSRFRPSRTSDGFARCCRRTRPCSTSDRDPAASRIRSQPPATRS